MSAMLARLSDPTVNIVRIRWDAAEKVFHLLEYQIIRMSVDILYHKLLNRF